VKASQVKYTPYVTAVDSVYMQDIRIVPFRTWDGMNLYSYAVPIVTQLFGIRPNESIQFSCLVLFGFSVQ